MIPSSRFISLRHGKGFIESHDIHALVWRAQQKNKALPLVCVHGLTRNAWDFARLAGKLCATRDVIALDMPGRNASAALKNPLHYAYPHYVEDCMQALEKMNLRQVDWLGTSMGGIIGIMIAKEKNTPIRRLVLNDIGPYLPLAGLQRIGQYVGRAQRFANIDEAARYCRATYADFGIYETRDWWALTVSSIREEKDAYGLNYDSNIGKVFSYITSDIDLWPVYEAVQTPTLLLRGVRSDILRAHDAQKMTQTGPKAKLVTFEGCGHAPALVDDDQIGTIAEFLNS